MAAKSGAFRSSRDDKAKREPALKPREVAASNLDRLIH